LTGREDVGDVLGKKGFGGDRPVPVKSGIRPLRKLRSGVVNWRELPEADIDLALHAPAAVKAIPSDCWALPLA
jgi:hypothetical protein